MACDTPSCYLFRGGDRGESGDGGTPERVVGKTYRLPRRMHSRALCACCMVAVCARCTRLASQGPMRKHAAQYEYHLPPPSFSEQTVKES